MTFEEKFGPKFEIDSIVDENEIKKMEMRPLIIFFGKRNRQFPQK